MIDRDELLIHYIKKYYSEMNDTLKMINDSYNEFLSNNIVKKSMNYDILQIEENFNHLSEKTISKINKKDIKGIIDVHNFMDQGYTKLNDNQIWEIVHKDLPNLLKQLS